MSTRTYNLRTWIDTGIANQSQIRNNPFTPLHSPTLPTHDIPPHIWDSVPDTGRTTALYSDVVVSRPPSPQKETSSVTAVHSVERPDAERLSVSQLRLEDTAHTYGSWNIEIVGQYTSSEETISPQDQGDTQWTMVKHRRACSLGSIERVNKTHSKNHGIDKLTLEQTQAIEKVTSILTEDQKRTLEKRKRNLTHKRQQSSSSWGEGPSKQKGKGIDPREWGNLNISQESLDIGAQAAALNSIAQGKKSKENIYKIKTGTHRAGPKDGWCHYAQLPAESHPVAQLAWDSYLGMALHNVEWSDAKEMVPLDENDLPMDPSSSDGESSDLESSSLDSELSYQRQKNQHGQSWRCRRLSSGSLSKLVIKPIAPKEYNGSADTCAYHWFVQESEAYLRDGKVKGARTSRIFLLLYYLTDKVYDFFMQKVANDKLFNFCFPVDYRMQLRRTLAHCHQNKKSVAEYTHELNELFNMIGDIPASGFWCVLAQGL